ncbi:hypothetical protein Pcinc_018160 [Petrolisthes cinctipes]|nr:hypothetical protein Pcinc_018160 [Petrolisthes cinctipes]
MVMRNARKQKGSGIYIDEDLCPASQEVRKSQIPLMKHAREEGKIDFFKHIRLIIKDIKDNNYQPLVRSSGSEGVSTRGTDGAVTGSILKYARDGESSVGAEDGSRDVSTRGAMGDITGESSVRVGGGGPRPTPGCLALADRGNQQQQTSHTIGHKYSYPPLICHNQNSSGNTDSHV